jgi:hypothetical protein
MSKGIAIQTILMLLAGIVVVGIVVYMVYRYATKSSIGQEECRATIMDWCVLCNNFDIEWKTDGGPEQTAELLDCVTKYYPSPQFIQDPVTKCFGNNCYCRNFIQIDAPFC